MVAMIKRVYIAGRKGITAKGGPAYSATNCPFQTIQGGLVQEDATTI
jgi:hypothetical protein